ncbi:UDP-glycosyltransferase 72B1 [Iris pallida]|uniref:Glycosyltransferase n=1 Tax=Iris pallida TaxID=29817 RepID=A0AAX6DKN2_IRIPA|nr:UDP-glycosyltransferase 72B1 [Iris pallida]
MAPFIFSHHNFIVPFLHHYPLLIMDQTPHIVILPTPGMGHLIPLAELATRLVLRHGFTATFITYAESASKAQTAYLASLPPSVASLSLPPVDLADLSPTACIETRICVTAARSVPALARLLRDLKDGRHVVAFVADLFGGDSLVAAREVGVPAYVFFPSNLLTLSVILHLPALDAAVSCEFRDLPEPLKLPGCVPIPGSELISPIQDRKDDAYRWVVNLARKYREAEGILVNTFDEIEPEASEVLKKVQAGRPPVYTVGPLIHTGGASSTDASGCLSWLDKQPRSSVLFVSFGSGGTLSTEQTRELALGLECSGQRFIWVVRSPSDQKADANFFNAQSATDSFEFLPEGFTERTRDVGLVVSSWAPQIEILKHESTGGFLTHCGWNSTLESVVYGVPMIAWPLYAEQKQNAVMLVEGTKIALRAKAGADGVVRKDAISRTVKELMEGEEGKAVRHKVKELQAAGAKALAEDGKSSKALAEIANKWKGML